jgi:hypothetical protein
VIRVLPRSAQFKRVDAEMKDWYSASLAVTDRAGVHEVARVDHQLLLKHVPRYA